MTVTVKSPLGQGTWFPNRGELNQFFTAGTRWDSRKPPDYPEELISFYGVSFSKDKLTVTNDAGIGNPGQGVMVYPEISKSPGSGIFYWEITWDSIVDKTAPVGAGVIALPPNVDFGGDPQNFYENLVTGQGGLIVRPNGDVYGQAPDGFPPGYYPALGFFPTISSGDTVGFLADFTLKAEPNAYTIGYFICSGAHSGTSGLLFLVPGGSYVPCVIFDSVPFNTAYVATANFGIGTPGSPPLLALTVFPDAGWDTITLGWPNDVS